MQAMKHGVCLVVESLVLFLKKYLQISCLVADFLKKAVKLLCDDDRSNHIILSFTQTCIALDKK